MFDTSGIDHNKPTLAHIAQRIEGIAAPHSAETLTAENVEAFCARPGLTLLFLAEDPLRVPESWDVAVILADALKRIAAPVRIGLLGPEAGRPPAGRYGIKVWPALVGLRDGEYLGSIEGMLDWAVFERRLRELIAAEPGRAPSIGIPVVALGPGSQPVEEPLDTLGLPSDMPTFRPPVNDSTAPASVYRAALDVLHEILAGLEATPYGAERPVKRPLSDLNRQVMLEVTEMLGQGEVSVRADKLGVWAQETAFTGVWRVCAPGIDVVEAGAFPSLLRELALARTTPAQDVAVPPGLMNAPAILAEIRERSATWRAGDAAHVINLSLLPVTPEDLAFLDRALGRADFSILSRGYGNCRITATAYPHVWWVQYFNAMEKLILNSIEIVDVPGVALAAAEDYSDSRQRLAEWIESLASAR
jgi:hydrogenase-1 operon protein HyaF